MEDFERYGDYTEFDEDIPQNKSAFVLTLKILVAVVCFGVIGLIVFRLLMFNYYPSSMKKVYFSCHSLCVVPKYLNKHLIC